MKTNLILLLLSSIFLISNCSEKNENTSPNNEIKVVHVNEADIPKPDSLDPHLQNLLNHTSQQTNIKTENMGESYWYVYPQQDYISISSIDTFKDSSIVLGVIRLNISPQVLTAKYKYDKLSFQELIKDEMVIKFEDAEKPVAQKKTITIEITTTNNKKIENTIVLGFYPTTLYKASGLTAPNFLIVHKSDLAVQKSQVKDWIPTNGSESNKQFAEQVWGKAINKSKYTYPYQKAQALAIAIIKELEPHKGNPSDTMSGIHPFEQYTRALSGKDAVWCANISYIFKEAANALGVPVRHIQLGNISTHNDEVNLAFAEGHTITEIYDEKLNKWVLMDLTLYILEASLNEVPLSAMEFYYLVNNPSFQDMIKTKEYNLKKGLTIKKYLNQSVALPSVKNYYKKNQRFSFVHK